MGRQIIKQPNGLYCIYSTVVDNIIYYDITREEWIELRAQEEKERVTENINELCDKIEKGERAYYQFTKSYEEILLRIKVVHGEKEMTDTMDAIEHT